MQRTHQERNTTVKAEREFAGRGGLLAVEEGYRAPVFWELNCCFADPRLR